MLTISKANYEKQKEKHLQEFPGGPVVRTQGFHCWSLGSILVRELRSPKATRCRQEKKQQQLFYTVAIIEYRHTLSVRILSKSNI